MFVVKKDIGEMKDITLRGVNKELYEEFTVHAKKHGLSAGDAFDGIIMIDKQPWRKFIDRHRPPRHGKAPEIIRDLEKLVVSKKDLISAGEKTMFLFSKINDLTFEKDVDAATLVKHVRLIRKCKTSFLGDIPKIIQLGIIRKRRAYTHPSNKDQLKDITIRNVSIKLYDEFVSNAKDKGKTTGEYFSEILAHAITFFDISETLSTIEDREVLVVREEEELFISKTDLEVLGKRGLIIYSIPKIEFAKDIGQDLFLKTVIRLIKCDQVILPSSIPRLIVLSRAIQCKETKIA
ncbi:MAG: hypothetical protein GNW80_00050 [Asgard group archaeon]|nr:hypothetical protein [Asgard group archaeon]